VGKHYYDWRIRADKPLLRYLSFCSSPSLPQPPLGYARGEESLRLELARRHARTPEEREHFSPSRSNDHFGHSAVAAERRHHRG